MGHTDDPEDVEFSLDSTQLTRRMKHLAKVLNHFWNHWRSEYLNGLRKVHSYTTRKQSSNQPSSVAVSDVVIVHLPRGLWRLGKIEEVMKGRDGRIRGVTVKMANKDGKQSLLNRPIQLLYPLEVKCHETTSEEGEVTQNSNDQRHDSQVPSPSNSDSDKNAGGTPQPIRPRRAAAQRADERRNACMFELENN